MHTNLEVGVASTLINGNTVLSFSSIQRNRGNRFELDLSNSTVIGILQAYQAKRQKSNPRYSLANAISVIRSIEESERKAAETSLDPNGQPMQWPGPFMPVDICSDFWVAFENYVVNVPGQYGKKRHSSTARSYANSIVAALAWAQAYGAKIDPTFRDIKFGRYEKKKITPSADQISLIYHFDLDSRENRRKVLSMKKEMKVWNCSLANVKKVRDHFVLSCSLGQRISDSKRIDPTNFEGTVYSTTQQKTGNHARVDIQQCAIDWDVAKEILDKYKWKAPAYGMDTGLFNKILHLLLRVIGGPFNRIITWQYKEGGEIHQESAPVWKLITSHVARRTFITNEIKKGKPLPEVMRESGHSDARNMSIYYAPEHK